MKMVYILVAAIGAGAVVAGVRSYSGPSTTQSQAPVAPIAAEAPVAAADPGESGGVDGEVLEVINVPNYSYLRIGPKGSEGTWAAVATANLKVGDVAHVRGATKMTDFSSPSLKKTFSVIYFGSLEGAQAPHGMGPATGANPHGTSDPYAGGAAPGATGADPHAGGAAKPAAVEVKPAEKASGPNGATVAEVLGKRTQLAGKTVRIRGTVVKMNAGILGKTFLHLRDGSGDQAAGTNDITVTTQATPAVGDVVLIEGTVGLDLDLGSGYKFPTIVENAQIVTK